MSGEEPSEDDRADDGEEASPGVAPPSGEGPGESTDDGPDDGSDDASAAADDSAGDRADGTSDDPSGEADATAATADPEGDDAPGGDGAEDVEPGEDLGGDAPDDGGGTPATAAGEDEGTDGAGDETTEGDEGAVEGAEREPGDSSQSFFGGRKGPEEDREMPLTEHIEEMLRRLAVIVAIAGFVSLLVFPFADRIINFLWYSIMPGVPSEIARPRLYGVLEKLFTEVKVASLAGLIVALPVLVYETYAFMRPGLYPHERRYYLAAVPTSLVLAIVGVSFAYFVILPAIFVYFLYYSQDVATIGFALGRTFDLILLLMGYMALVFQIPLFILLAMMMGLVTRRWLAARRLLFWGGFLGLSFLFSPDPTGMAPIIVAATMIALFEGTLLLTKWTGRA